MVPGMVGEKKQARCSRNISSCQKKRTPLSRQLRTGIPSKIWDSVESQIQVAAEVETQ